MSAFVLVHVTQRQKEDGTFDVLVGSDKMVDEKVTESESWWAEAVHRAVVSYVEYALNQLAENKQSAQYSEGTES